ncbi:hypothetical protein LSAT2_006866 [Lamellibrachia satsuma]|nr:hypothetical protein LSAT2_006866 [Lamellibrachia satsuma]
MSPRHAPVFITLDDERLTTSLANIVKPSAHSQLRHLTSAFYSRWSHTRRQGDCREEQQNNAQQVPGCSHIASTEDFPQQALTMKGAPVARNNFGGPRVIIIKGHFNRIAVAFPHFVCLHRMKDSAGWHLSWMSPCLMQVTEQEALNTQVLNTDQENCNRMVAAAFHSTIQFYVRTWNHTFSISTVTALSREHNVMAGQPLPTLTLACTAGAIKHDGTKNMAEELWTELPQTQWVSCGHHHKEMSWLLCIHRLRCSQKQMLFEEMLLQSGIQQNEDIATWFLLEVLEDNHCTWRHSKRSSVD